MEFSSDWLISCVVNYTISDNPNVIIADDSMLERFQREHPGDTFLFINNLSSNKLLPLQSHHATFLRTMAAFRSKEEIWQYLASWIVQLRLVIYKINIKMTNIELEAKLKEIS